MGLDKDVSLTGMQNAISNQLNQMAKNLQDQSKEVGGLVPSGIQGAIDSGAKKINLNSIDKVLKKSINELKSNTRTLESVFDGMTSKISIDFTDVDMNTEDVKYKVQEMLEGILSTGTIDLDGKNIEKALNGILTSYVRNNEKLKLLQENSYGLVGEEYIKNQKEQIALMSEMHHVASFFGADDYFEDWSRNISSTTANIREELLETENRLEETFEAIKGFGTGTHDFKGKFNFGFGEFDKSELEDRIGLMEHIITLERTLEAASPNMRSKDFITGLSPDLLEKQLEQDRKNLELMERYGFQSTTDIEHKKEEILNRIDNEDILSRSNMEQMSNNASNKELYEQDLKNLEAYIEERDSILSNMYGGGSTADFLSDDEFKNADSKLNAQLKLARELKDNLIAARQIEASKNAATFQEEVNKLDEGFRALPATREKFESLYKAVAEDSMSATDAIKEMTQAHEAWVALQKKEPKKKRSKKKTEDKQPKEVVSPPEEQPKKKRGRKKKQEDEAEQLSLFDEPKESKEKAKALKEVADGAEAAAEAKAKLAEETAKKAEEEKKAKEITKKEKESLDELAGSIVRADEAHDKVKTIYDPDENIIAKTVTDSRVRENAIETESKFYRYEDGERKLEATTIVEDFKKRAAELKKEKDKIALAQKTLSKFLSQFESKTAGQASTIKGYTELKGFTIGSLDDIEKTTQQMIALDTEYNNVTKNFRKGTKSMNPFVNAITGAVEMEDKISQVGVSFGELAKKPEALKQKVDGLNDKFKEMKRYAKFDDQGNLLEITDIYNFSKAYGELNAEIKSVNSSIQTQRKEEKAQIAEYKQLEALQNKLYAAKTKRATASYDADDLDVQDKRIKRLEDEYNAKKKNAKYTDNTNKILAREGQLQSDIDSIVQRRIQHEEELAYVQYEKEKAIQKEKEINAAYKEREELIKAEAEAEKQRAAAKKEEDAFYAQEEKAAEAERKRIAKEEDDAWKAYRAEQDAAAQKEREINLAYEAKAAQEASAVEKDLLQTRKEIEIFNKEEDQREKEASNQKQKELNELYSKRKSIIEETLRYTIDLQKAGLNLNEILNNPIMQDATSRLHGVDSDIDKYGSLVDQSVLDKQDEILKDGLRKSFNKSDIDDISDRYKNLIKLQDDYYKKYKAFENEQGNEAEQLRLLDLAYEAEKKYLDAKKQANLTSEQTIELREKEIAHEKELEEIRKSNINKQSAKDDKDQYSKIASLYDKYVGARSSYSLMATSPDAKDYTNQMQVVYDTMEKRRKELLSLGVDVNDIENSSVLTQEQKNKLLEKEQQLRERLIKQIAEAMDKENKSNEKEQERIDRQNKNYGKSRYNTEARNYDKIMASYRAIESESGVSDSFDKKVKEYENAYKELTRLREIFANDPNAIKIPGLTDQFQDAAVKAENLRKVILAIINESNKFSQFKEFAIDSTVFDPTKYNTAQDAMKSFANEVSNGTFTFKSFDETGTKMTGTIINANGAVEKITVAFDKATGEIIAFGHSTDKVITNWDRLKGSMISGAKQLATMYLSFHDIVRYLRQGYEEVKAIDTAMTELKKVTDETEETYAKFLSTASKTAGSIGSTVKDFTTVTSDFARLGYSIEEASDLAKTALIYENVGDGFNSVNEASESIISTMKAFNIEAEYTMGIVDRFNEVGNNFAIDSKGIGDALQRSASALVEGGNSIDEAIGLVTAANSVIQNPEQVGTALKTLSLRLRSTKIELEEMGEDAEGAATSTAKLRAQLLGLTGGKVDIMLDDTTFKNTTQILREMSAIWGEMDDISKAGALELMGGKRQANILSSLIANFDTVEAAIESSSNSAGSALEENQKYIESIQGHIDVLTNSWQTMWNNALRSDVIKFFIDLANTLVKIVNNVGLFQVAIGAAVGAFTFNTFGGEQIGLFAELLKKIPIFNTLLTGFTGKITAAGMSAKAASTATGLFTSALTGLTTLGIAIAIPLVIKFGDVLIKTAKEIKDSAKEAVDSYNSVQEKLTESSKVISDISSDYKKLSNGVDEFGNNINLTTSEYERYNEIVNQIADMFPDMVRGYTDEGNAIIKNKGNVEALTEAYKALSDEANNAIIAKAADIMKDYKYTTEGGFFQWDKSIPESIAAAKELDKILRNQDNYNFSAFNEARPYANEYDKIVTLLSDAGISRLDGERNDEYVKRAVSEFPGIVQSIVNTWESTVNAAISNVKPLVQAYLDTSVGYAGLTNDQKSVFDSIASSFDEEFFNQFEGDASKMQQTIENMVLNLKTSGIDDEYSLVLNARTMFNNNKVTAGEYQDTVHKFIEELEQLQENGLLDENNIKYIKASIGIDVDEDASIDALIAHAESLFGDNLTKEIQSKILNLNYSDLIALDGIKVSDDVIESWDELTKIREKNKALAFELDYNVEVEDLEKVRAALDETTTATGMSVESIGNLKSRYRDLEGYDADKLFEETAHGIHLNVDAARELEQEYENLNKSKIDEKLDTLVEEYNDLTLEIQNTSDAYKRAELYYKRQNIIDQINDTATLATRYEGLTSAYNKWQKAQEGAEERDMYEGIIEGKKEVDEEIARGWLDAGTREYIELLSGKDLSTASFEEILAIYQKLNKTIAGTKYDVYDFFTKDSDDNATVDGIYNFFDAIMAVQEEGQEWVKKNEDGSFVFDFSVNGGEEAIAEALGISEELVQIILRAAADAGFNINLDSAYADLAELKDEATLANEKLKELGATDYDFNINSTNIDNLNEQIEEAGKMLDKFRNQDGTVNIKAEGAKEAQTMLSTLIYQKQTLDDAAVLKVDTTNANAGVETVVKKLQDFKAAYNELEVKLAIGEDTTDAQAKLNDAITQLQMESPSIRAKLGIDLTKSNEEINAAINNISADKLIELGVDESKIEGYKAAEHTTEGEVIWTNNIDEVTSWMKKKHEVDGIVKWKNDDTGVNTFFYATGFGVANGTAHAHGSAFVQGNWGAHHTETALVGELGPEMVVRGDQWFTVGENGAEFTDIKKGDIIFNHKQTEDLLSNGYVTGRGKAYAAGTGALLSAQKEYNLAVAARKKAEKNNKGSWADIQNLNSAIAREKKALENYTNAKNVYYGIAKSNAYKAYGSSEYKSHSDVYGSTGSGPSKAQSKELRQAGTAAGAGSDKDNKQLIDFIEIKLEEIEAIISKTSAELTNYVDDTSSISQKNSAYDKLVNAEKEKAQTYFQAAEYYNKKAAELLEKVPESYREKAQNGAIDIKDFVGESQGKIAEAIQNYRDMANKADGAESSYLESIAQQATYRVEQLEDIASDYDNIVNYIGKESTLIQAQMDLVEASGERLSADYYDELIQNTKEQIAQRVKEKQDLQEALDSGDIKVGTDEWYQAVDLIAEVDEEIIQCNTDIEEFKNSINDLKWEALDKLIARFDHIDSQLSHLHERLTDGKVVDDDGNWNEKGIAALGVLAQQMEVAEAKSKQYADAINELEKDYNNGLYSTDEYNEKLAELTENQWDSIEAYEDAKDAIVDLNKTRIDAIKDGIKKELDAYKELIDKKKELLDADKDLHDFEKSVAEQQKDISTIERRLAALSGDTSTSAAAERKQLEAELLEAQAALEEIYYDRSIENQKTALDEEYTNYEEVKNEEMEALDKYLEDEEKVISDSMDVVKKNTNTVLGEINKISKQYGVQISDSIVQPWKDGSNAISTFDNTFNTFSGSFMNQLQAIIDQEKALEEQAKLTAQALLEQLEAEQEASSGGSGYYFDYSYTGNSFSGYYDKNGNALTKDQLETELGTVGGIVYDGGGNAHDANTAKRPTTTSSYSSSNKSSSSSSKSGTVSNTKGNLGYGSSGADVKALQQSLNAMGYNCGSADGVFGAKTQAAVKQYQKDQGIKADGIVGSNTKKELKKDGYAKGTLGTSKSDWAWIDEIGEELVLHAGSDGKLEYLTKGTSVIPADLTSKLMDLAIDPTQTLENSKPVINAPHITNNEINIDMSFGSVVNIEHVDQGDIPDLTKAVEKQMDKYMKNLNNQIRKYSR